MSRQINFLAERRKSLTKIEVQDQKAIRIASIVFTTTFLIFLTVFGIRFYFDRQLFQVREAQKTARSQILNDQAIEQSFVIFVYKLTALANLTQDKQEKNEALNFFSNLFGSDVFVTQMSYLEKERILSLKIQSDSVFSLRKVFELLNTDAVRAEFTSVNPSDLTRTPQGDYEMVITAVVKPKPAGEVAGPVQPATLNGAGGPPATQIVPPEGNVPPVGTEQTVPPVPPTTETPAEVPPVTEPAAQGATP
ncbi:hypothetical protein H3C70_05275 [Patescibacteria group bacterium]|nr:hypothetical protein [Patescibacteria group bacterium]